MMKRIFDFLFAFFGLILSLPLWILITVVIFFIDGKPIFYSQERVGKNGRLFKGVKFRTMVSGAESVTGPIQAKENDERVTMLGLILRKSAMDELPQLWNILVGDMSLVGPRALRPAEKDVDDNVVRNINQILGYRERVSIRPGLTGLAQILAPRDISREEKFKYDVWYVKNQSFFIDIYIVALSFLVTFCGSWENRGDKINILVKPLRAKLIGKI